VTEADALAPGRRRRRAGVTTYDAGIDTRRGWGADPSRAGPEPAALASVLGARRDGSAGVDSSRDLLMTVLGEFVLPHGGHAWTQSLIALMELLGVRDKAARQALARMCDRGWLERDRVGRQTRWRLTAHARELLEAGAHRIYGFGRDVREWDGTWLVLLASVPEKARHVRYRMGLGLTWAGFGLIGQGIWLSPWREQEQVAVDLLTGLGVEATSFHGELGRLGSGPRLAGMAWDLPALRARYERFLADTDPLVGSTPPAGDAAVELAALVHRWRRFPFLDPDLPPDLLPEDWPGRPAAERFAVMRASLLPAAGEWWRTMEVDLTPARASS
jgi:phenylacetic acid degradation operon negative regulatory protein